MPPTRDHKRIGEGDTGANTGGMGTISDQSLLSPKQIEEITEKVIEPTLKGCRDEGFPFRGILFLGLMMTDEETKVLEYNVRFGDPETQAILSLLETDITEICEAINSRTLDKIQVEWKEETAACVVIASKGYPQNAVTGDIINGLDSAGKRENVEGFSRRNFARRKWKLHNFGRQSLGRNGSG